MNDDLAPNRRPEITLARYAAFALGRTEVRPASRELVVAGQVATLEPQVMKVLVALGRAHGTPVSRDELIESCWGRQVVTDAAINRCVALLRKALAADANLRVETIPTIGYRLVVEETGETAAPPAAQTSRRRPVRIVVAAALLLGVAAAFFFALRDPAPIVWRTVAFRPLTADRGIKSFPALSPDGTQIAYSVRPDARNRRDIWLRGIEQGTPLQVTANAGNDYGAAWSPDGTRLAFIRAGADGACSLIMVPVPLGPERVVARCNYLPLARLSWLDTRTLLAADHDGPRGLRRIRGFDIETGAVRNMTAPPPGTQNEGDPQVSPDGRFIAFRRSVQNGGADLVLLDTSSGSERTLISGGWHAAGYVWSADSRHIFFSSNRGAAVGLWTVDTQLGGPARAVSLGLGALTFTRMSADRSNRVAVEVPRGSSKLAQLNPDGTIVPVTDATGADWDVDGFSDGSAVYVSNRGGAYELWLRRADGESLQLTSLQSAYFATPRWSPDGQSIAFVVVQDRSVDLYTVARDGSRLRRVTDDGIDKGYPVWSADGSRLFYVARHADGARLYQLALTPGARPEPVAGGEGWHVLRAGDDGKLFGQRLGEGAIRTLDRADPLPGIVIADGDNWTVGAEGLYELRDRWGFAPAIWLHPWQGDARKIADTPYATGPLGRAPSGVLFGQIVETQCDLALIELAAGR